MGVSAVQGILQGLCGAEHRNRLGGKLFFLAGAGIFPHPCFPVLHGELAEAGDFDLAAVEQGFLDDGKQGVGQQCGVMLGVAGALRNGGDRQAWDAVEDAARTLGLG